MIYTSVDNKKIKDIKKLNTKKYRDKKDCTDVHNKWCYDILLKDDPKLAEQFRGIRERFAKLGILE